MRCGAMQLAHWFITSNYSHNYHKLPICCVCLCVSVQFQVRVFHDFCGSDSIIHIQIQRAFITIKLGLILCVQRIECGVVKKERVHRGSSTIPIQLTVDTERWIGLNCNGKQEKNKVNRFRGTLQWHTTEQCKHTIEMVQITSSNKARIVCVIAL